MTDKFRYDQQEVEQAITMALDRFYDGLISKLNSIDLWPVLKRKNPYLFKAHGLETGQEVIENILSAFISSSEETTFGDFFETIAIVASGGIKSITDSMDLEIRDGNIVRVYAIKSGPNAYNSQSKGKQKQAFDDVINRLKGHAVDLVIGCAYGNKRTGTSKRPRAYREVCGKDFWYEITGDPDFYLKIIDFIGDKPTVWADKYKEAYATAVNRLTKQLLDGFCDDSGRMDWKKLVEAVSSRPEKVKITAKKTTKKKESLISTP